MALTKSYTLNTMCSHCRRHLLNLAGFRNTLDMDVTAVTSQFVRPASSATKKLQIHSTPPSDTSQDWVGPPDADSNLRVIKFKTPANETQLERSFRQLQEDTQKWNQAYWAKHNQNFFGQKEQYIKARLQELGPKNEDGSPRKLTAEDLSTFYAKFLNDNYEMHKKYNIDWYKRNIYMLWPALKVKFQKVFTR